MIINKEYIETALEEFFARAEVCRKYGIPEVDVVNGEATVPPGWTYDHAMCYYMPPTLLES